MPPYQADHIFLSLLAFVAVNEVKQLKRVRWIAGVEDK